MLESKRQKQIVEWLEDSRSCIVVKQTTNRGYGRTGYPDLLVLPVGTVWQSTARFIETKTPQGKLSPMQRRRITQLRAQGCPTMVARTVEEVADAWPHPGGNRVWWEFEGGED